MKTKAVRIYGINDLRLEEFELPEIKDNEILARVVSDSLCMSSHKLALLGASHKRIRYDLQKQPCIIGHEFCGVLEKVGSKWADQFKEGDRFAIQPALSYPENGKPSLWAPGYSYEFIGGNATWIIIPKEVMEMGCLLPCHTDNFFMGSLAEPVSCIAGAFKAQYHTTYGSYVHHMGITEGGSLALLASAGPMGLGAIDFAIHGPRKPGRIIVTDIDQERIKRAESLLTPNEAKKNNVELIYVNTKELPDPVARLKELNGGRLFDDVFVFAPVRKVLELGNALLGSDGCLNFFAGPTDTSFSALFNFYNVHYESHHIVGTSGGNTEDMLDSLDYMAKGLLNPVFMITHVGGLDSVSETTINLDKIPGGKKLVYTGKKLPLTALEDYEEKGRDNADGLGELYRGLAEICKANNNLWSKEAEDFLLENAPDI